MIKHKGEAKTERHTVRFTEQEMRNLQKIADAEYITISDVIRKVLKIELKI